MTKDSVDTEAAMGVDETRELILVRASDVIPRGRPFEVAEWEKSWRYDTENLALYCRHAGSWYVDVERCRRSSVLLDYIFQAASHGWGTPLVLGRLILALDDILYPQANLCSSGCDKKFDATRYLKSERHRFSPCDWFTEEFHEDYSVVEVAK